LSPKYPASLIINTPYKAFSRVKKKLVRFRATRSCHLLHIEKSIKNPTMPHQLHGNNPYLIPTEFFGRKKFHSQRRLALYKHIEADQTSITRDQPCRLGRGNRLQKIHTENDIRPHAASGNPVAGRPTTSSR
jgi:hypothetical protein